MAEAEEAALGLDDRPHSLDVASGHGVEEPLDGGDDGRLLAGAGGYTGRRNLVHMAGAQAGAFSSTVPRYGPQRASSTKVSGIAVATSAIVR